MSSTRTRWCRLTLALAVTLLAFLVVSSPSFAQGGEPQYFAIRGAKVIPVSGPAIDGATVVMAHGVITAIGKDVQIPPDAWIVEGKGLTVYPGLIDAFTDVGIPSAGPEPGPAPAAGGGGRRAIPPPTLEVSHGPEDRPGTTPWRSAADEVSLSDKRIESWRNAGFTTVVSSPKTGMFPGQASVLDLAGDRASDMVVKTPVAIPISLQPTGGFGNFPGSLMGAIAYVHQVWVDTNWSARAQELYEANPRSVARPRYDRTEAVLLEAREDHAIVLIPANNTVQLRRALGFLDEWDLVNAQKKVDAAIYGGQMAYEVSDEIAAKKIPVLVNLKWPEGEKDTDPDEKPSLRVLRFRDKAPSSPAALAKAKVEFAFYSGGITAPKDILKSVKKSIDAGLAADAALRALTLSAAEIYGVADRMGSIETGKIANLVVADGDLFDEKTKIKMVFVDGKRFEAHEPEKPKEPPKGNMSGTWKLAYTTPDGPEESTAAIEMATDGSLSGTLTSKRGTGNIINGYLSVDKFSFTINIPIEGSPTDVVFAGTFDGTSLKGTVNVETMGVSIDFTGTKPTSQRNSQAGGAQ